MHVGLINALLVSEIRQWRGEAPPALPLRSARPWRQMAGGLRVAFGMFIKEKKIFLPSLEYTLYIHFIC